MNSGLLLAASLLLVSSSVFAQSDQDGPEVERVAVRNPLYSPAGRFELGARVGFQLVNELTDHVNLNASVGYNVSNTFALELRAGYAISRHTRLAASAATQLLMADPSSSLRVTDDLANLWEMKANTVAGVRWQPIYGKLSFVADLPVHFQGYLWAGAGSGTFQRESVVYCTGTVNRATGTCGNGYLTNTRASWLTSVAAGFRFFTYEQGGLSLEVRNYLYPDSYLTNIDRTVAERQGDPQADPTTGDPAQSAGLTALWMFDVGYTFLF